MELPNDIWATIIQKTRSLKNCKKLYDALPMRVKNNLESIYLAHKASLNLRFICAFRGNFSIYNSDILEKRTYLSDILLVKYIKNWNTKKRMMDCIAVGTKWGKILFLDAITMEHIEYIDVGGSKLSDIEFHPTKSIMLLVTDGFYGKKLKILRFDLDRSEFTVLEDSGIKNCINVWDFLRRGNDIYFYINQKGDSRIYKQTGDEYKLIYSSINNLFKFYCKNDLIIFMENNILKVIDLHDNLLIDEFCLENSAVDFMILPFYFIYHFKLKFRIKLPVTGYCLYKPDIPSFFQAYYNTLNTLLNAHTVKNADSSCLIF